MVSFSPYPCQHLLSLVLDIAILTVGRWYIFVVLVCISLIINGVEHVFVYLLIVCFLWNEFYSVLLPIKKIVYLVSYFWLHRVFIAAHRLSLFVVSRGYSCLQCAGFSLQWFLLVCSTGSIVVVHRFSCSMASSGIFLDQGSNQYPLHCKAVS